MKPFLEKKNDQLPLSTIYSRSNSINFLLRIVIEEDINKQTGLQKSFQFHFLNMITKLFFNKMETGGDNIWWMSKCVRIYSTTV